MACFFPKSRCKLDCWYGDWWYSLHRRQVEKIISNQAEAIILGDSLVAGLMTLPAAIALGTTTVDWLPAIAAVANSS